MTVIYESGLSGAFMYMWGCSDVENKKNKPPSLLLNSQNPLDHLIGDLFGAVNTDSISSRRWFIAELKQQQSGFAAEVHGAKAKNHRTALYQHLRDDKACRDLARTGHFAVWLDVNGLAISPYAHAVGPGMAGGPGPGWQELDYQSFVASFDEFYKNMNDVDVHRFSMNASLYGAGLGLPIDGMQAYLKCILNYCLPLPTSPGIVSQAASELVFGYVNPTGNAALALGSFEGLLASCGKFSSVVANSLPEARRD